MSEETKQGRLSVRPSRLRTDGGERGDGGETGEDDEPLGDLRRRLERQREGRTNASEETDNHEDSGGETPDNDELADILGGDDDEATDPESSDLFTEMDVDDIDTDAVWDAVLSEDDDTGVADVLTEEPLTTDIPTGVTESTVETGTEHVVPKRKYCESCRFFTSPPDVGCTYEGSSIVEVVSTTEFRVRNCPVVQGVVDVKGSPIEEEASVPSEASSSN